MPSSKVPKVSGPKPVTDDDGDIFFGEDDGLQNGTFETTEVLIDGKPYTIKYRGVDPSLPIGSKEYKRAKRLADNRASAARSRMLAQAKFKILEESYKKLEMENQRLRTMMEKSQKTVTMPNGNRNDNNEFSTAVASKGSKGKKSSEAKPLSSSSAVPMMMLLDDSESSTASTTRTTKSSNSTVSRQSSASSTTSNTSSVSDSVSSASSSELSSSSVPVTATTVITHSTSFRSQHPQQHPYYRSSPAASSEDSLLSFLSSNPAFAASTVASSSSSLSSSFTPCVPTVLPELLTSPERSLFPKPCTASTSTSPPITTSTNNRPTTGKKRRTSSTGEESSLSSDTHEFLPSSVSLLSNASPTLSSTVTTVTGSNPLSPVSSRCTSPVSKRTRCNSSSSSSFPNGKKSTLSDVIRRTTEKSRPRHFFSVAALCSALFACLITLLDGAVSAGGYTESKTNGGYSSSYEDYNDDNGFCYDTDFTNDGGYSFEEFVPIDMNDLGSSSSSSSDSNHSHYEQFHHQHHSSPNNEYNTFFDTSTVPDDFNTSYTVLMESNFTNDTSNDQSMDDKVPGLLNADNEDKTNVNDSFPKVNTLTSSSRTELVPSRSVLRSPVTDLSSPVAFVDPFHVTDTLPTLVTKYNDGKTVHGERRGEAMHIPSPSSSLPSVLNYFTDPSKLFAFMGAKETFVQKVPEFLQVIRNRTVIPPSPSIDSYVSSVVPYEATDEDTLRLVRSLEDLYNDYRNPVERTIAEGVHGNVHSNVPPPRSAYVYSVPSSDSFVPSSPSSSSMTTKIMLCITLLSSWIARESSKDNDDAYPSSRSNRSSGSSSPFLRTDSDRDATATGTRSSGHENDGENKDSSFDYPNKYSNEKKRTVTSLFSSSSNVFSRLC